MSDSRKHNGSGSRPLAAAKVEDTSMRIVSSLQQKDAGADPLRVALAEALETARAAKEGVERQKAAIEKTRSSVRAAEAAVLTAEANVKKAQETHARAIADAATADDTIPISGIRAARQNVTDAEDQAAALMVALAQLRQDLSAWQADAREKEIAVEAAISAILAEAARKLIEKAAEIARELSPLRKALLAFVLNDRPPGVTDHLAFDRGREPLLEAQAAVDTFFQSFDGIEDKQFDLWTAVRKRLREDPHAPLPDFAPAA
jgi:hypothetical protein